MPVSVIQKKKETLSEHRENRDFLEFELIKLQEEQELLNQDSLRRSIIRNCFFNKEKDSHIVWSSI